MELVQTSWWWFHVLEQLQQHDCEQTRTHTLLKAAITVLKLVSQQRPVICYI